jgi:hypothetical protein
MLTAAATMNSLFLDQGDTENAMLWKTSTTVFKSKPTPPAATEQTGPGGPRLDSL